MSVNIFVHHPISKKQVPASEKDLLWYNYDTQELETYKGSRLDISYEYVEEDMEWKAVPKPITDKYQKDVVQKDKVMRWFNQYQNYNSTKISIESSGNEGIVFTVPDREEDDFTDALRRAKFVYENQ